MADTALAQITGPAFARLERYRRFGAAMSLFRCPLQGSAKIAVAFRAKDV